MFISSRSLSNDLKKIPKERERLKDYTERMIFSEGSKILLDTDLKIILLDQQNNFVETLKINEQYCKKF